MSKNLYHVSSTKDMGDVIGVGNLLKWDKTAKHIFSRELVDKCRNSCNAEYFLEEEEEKFVPPPDPELGRTSGNPARDCLDVLQNGPGEVSGVFYIKPWQ